MQPTKLKSMQAQAIIDFIVYSAAAIGPLALAINGKLTTHAASFPDPPLTVAAFLVQITTYNQKLADRASNATSDILAFNEARDVLESTLGALGNHVNMVAKGDAILVDQSGFPFYETGRPPNPGPPAAPTDLRLKHGTLSGTIIARYRPDRHASTNELNSSATSQPQTWRRVGSNTAFSTEVGQRSRVACRAASYGCASAPWG